MPGFLDYKALAEDYGRYHTHPLNRLCHAIGIPLIVFCAVRWTQVGASLFPWVSVALVLYALWSVPLALLMAAVLFVMALAAPLLGSWTFLALFSAGWIFQLTGHRVFEGKSPAFTKNLLHLLVGPLWILQEGAALFLSRGKTADSML